MAPVPDLSGTASSSNATALPSGAEPRHGRAMREGDDLNLLELAEVIWKGRWLVALITGSLTVVAVIYALLATEWYEAEALLIPAEEHATPLIGGQLSGLAAMAGVSAGSGNVSESLAVLQSREFIRAFLLKEEILPILYADQWDAQKERWLPLNAQDEPDLREAVRYFREDLLDVHVERVSGQVSVRVQWTDPELASHWTNRLVLELNSRMREQALSEASANVEYLRDEIASTSVVALQTSIGRLLESELQKLMLARGTEEFAFRIIDPAEPPHRRSRPRRVLAVLTALVAGLMFSIIVVLTSHAISTHLQNKQRST
jgi:uncharacterized protein involved in exopolysaccharide biosynthesis